jgi:micrococcal nuclease
LLKTNFERRIVLGVFLITIIILGALLFVIYTTQGGDSKPQPRKDPPPHRTVAKPSPFDAKTAKPLQTAQVLQGSVYVTDGDSIVISKTQVRLFGVDAPEMNHPYGKKAKWALVSLCKGQTVRAEVTDIDAYGRTVAKCYLPDGRDLSAEMVKRGLALDWPKFSGGKYLPLETPDARTKLWLADARQKGRMRVWEKFDNSKYRNGGAKKDES